MELHEKQYAIYFFEIVATLMIGYFLNESYGQWLSAFWGGVILLVLLVINGLIFGNALSQFGVFVFGLASMILLGAGAFYSFDLVSSIVSIFIALVLTAIIYFLAEG